MARPVPQLVLALCLLVVGSCASKIDSRVLANKDSLRVLDEPEYVSLSVALEKFANSKPANGSWAKPTPDLTDLLVSAADAHAKILERYDKSLRFRRADYNLLADTVLAPILESTLNTIPEAVLQRFLDNYVYLHGAYMKGRPVAGIGRPRSPKTASLINKVKNQSTVSQKDIDDFKEEYTRYSTKWVKLGKEGRLVNRRSVKLAAQLLNYLNSPEVKVLQELIWKDLKQPEAAAVLDNLKKLIAEQSA